MGWASVTVTCEVTWSRTRSAGRAAHAGGIMPMSVGVGTNARSRGLSQ